MSNKDERWGQSSLRLQLAEAFTQRDASVAATLLLDAFATASEAAQIALLQEDAVWLQRNVRSVLDQLDERRADVIAELSQALPPPLEYLLLT